MKEIALKFPNTELMASFLIENNISQGQAHSHLKIVTGIFSFSQEKVAREKYRATVEAIPKREKQNQ